ncbi:MAG: sigma-70 family RNA polymerase sigma factor [Polyangiales bacterium]
MLDPETERKLVRQVRRGSQAARHRLVEAHMRLVMAVARRYARRGVAFDDLVSEGALGLMEAVQRFDPTRGTRFGTYAAWWVHAYVRRYAYANRRIVGVPATRNARKVVWALRRARAEIQQKTGRDATRDELAEALGVGPADIEMVEGVLAGRDVPIGPVEHAMDPPTAAPTPEDEAADRQAQSRAQEEVREALAQLSEREREIVRRRLLEDDAETLTMLGRSFGISRERVRQIQQRAHGKLRESLRPAAA